MQAREPERREVEDMSDGKAADDSSLVDEDCHVEDDVASAGAKTSFGCLQVGAVEIGRLIPMVGMAFAMTSFRIFLTPLWTLWYIPVISPVFGQGHVWKSSNTSTLAILVHVSGGIVMLFAAAAQFDKTMRRSYPALHRWIGRLYVVSGLFCVLSLQILRDKVGQGFGDQPNHAMQRGIDAGGAIWIASTAGAIYYAAVARDYVMHRRLMVLSVCMAISPIMQRITIWVPLAPVAIFLRLEMDALSGVPFWRSRWPTSVADWDSWSWPSPIAEFQGPLVLSPNGYGVAEQMTFSVSSWSGLFISLALAVLLNSAPEMSMVEGLKLARPLLDTFLESIVHIVDMLLKKSLSWSLRDVGFDFGILSVGTSPTNILTPDVECVADKVKVTPVATAGGEESWKKAATVMILGVTSLFVGAVSVATFSVWVTAMAVVWLYSFLLVEILIALAVSFVTYVVVQGPTALFQKGAERIADHAYAVATLAIGVTSCCCVIVRVARRDYLSAQRI